ncbi:MAG: helix-turn-helix transcriptional regulator [Alphaproteobacteria bacterium]|nr:helix-turn-helix transcriptional regulator [Alphaproteobacteria bacterium]
MRAMLFDWGMKDEIAVFLPSLGGSSLGLFMDRAGDHFGKSHVRALRQIYPTLEGLCRAHQRYVFSKGTEPQADVVYSRPFAIDDAYGRRITANENWLAAERDAPNLKAATDMSAKVGHGPVQTGMGFVHSTALEADFPLAPGGQLHLLEVGAPAPPPLSIDDATKDFFLGELTTREREILNLILAGNPGQAIAAKLNISADTIKKHRRRLYDKLDITTERELFIRFLDYVFEVL